MHADQFVDVGPLRMRVQQRGSGRTIVLLHAGFSTIESSFPALQPRLAQRYATCALEQQGHGGTADLERPLSYEQMVADSAAALRSLGLTQSDVFGWSDGGIVGLGLAARHPALVRRLATIGSGYSPDAGGPAFRERMRQLDPANEHLAPFHQAYERVAPDPQRWPQLVAKVRDMSLAWRGWSEAEMRAIAAPVLVMLGDRDFVSPQHAVQLTGLLRRSRLAVLPGSDHAAPWSRGDWVYEMLVDFFEAADDAV